MAKKKNLGVGASCTVLSRYMHPAKTVSEKYPNRVHSHKMENLLVLRKEKKVVNRVERDVVVFRHDDFENVELHAVVRWAKVTSEGPAEKFFDNDRLDRPPQKDVDDLVDSGGNGGEKIPDHVFRLHGQAEDIAFIRGLGFEVDDDNDPAPENIPVRDQEGDRGEEGVATAEAWEGVCPRKALNVQNPNPSLRGVSEETIGALSYASMFLICLPVSYIKETVLEETNKNLEGEPLTWGEFLRWLGLWFFMATLSGFSRREYFSTVEINNNSGAPYRLNCWMSKKRFEDILAAISYTSREPPAFVDRFWEVREMLAAFNDHCAEVFRCSWVACLDESMSIWFNKWTCPGWMMVPRKPHPFGNEYHSINCGLCGFLFGLELQEGKDAPKELRHVNSDTNKHGKTCGLLLRLCKSLYFTGKIVVLDSGFCVLQALVELKKLGVYAHAVIKKRRYWPKYVKGDDMDNSMADKEVGEVGVWQGVLDGVTFFYFMMKEPAFVMKLMSTYGDTATPPKQEKTRRYYKDENGDTVRREFLYTTLFSNHFLYRHKIDDHNNDRHSVPAFEETWVTHRWPNRVFAFILAVCEINAYLAFRWFVWKNKPSTFKKPTVHQFRRRLAIELIYNCHLEDCVTCGVENRKRRRKTDHELSAAPKHAKQYKFGKWENTAKQVYQQHTCTGHGCSKRVRTYCSCCPGVWLCQSCHANHIVWCATSEESSG